MCHDDGNRPPAPLIQGEVASRSDLKFAAADGNRLVAHGASAGEPTGTGWWSRPTSAVYTPITESWPPASPRPASMPWPSTTSPHR
jgi:hypothetical protein